MLCCIGPLLDANTLRRTSVEIQRYLSAMYVRIQAGLLLKTSTKEFTRSPTFPQLFSESPTKGGTGFGPGGCPLLGIPLSGGRHLTNLGGFWELVVQGREVLIDVGVIILDGIAVLVALFLLWRSQRKRAAVGRRYVSEKRRVTASAEVLTAASEKCSCFCSDILFYQSARSSP